MNVLELPENKALATLILLSELIIYQKILSREKIKSIQIGKEEVKLSLFTEDMMKKKLQRLQQKATRINK
jgi:hypothetical protein